MQAPSCVTETSKCMSKHRPGAHLQQHRAGLCVATDGGPVQRGAALFVRQVDAGAQDQQQAQRVCCDSMA